MIKTFAHFGICGLLVVGFLLGFSSDAQAGEFFDNFDHGNADGWVFAPNDRDQWGDWRVENGALVQYLSGDHYKALVDNLLISNQVVEVKVSRIGYGGVVVWFQNVGIAQCFYNIFS